MYVCVLSAASANSSAKTETKNCNNKVADQNNNKHHHNNHIEVNNNKEDTENQKLKYELPSDYKYEIHKCICDRPQKVFECGRCHHYFHGRIRETCKLHPLVSDHRIGMGIVILIFSCFVF